MRSTALDKSSQYSQNPANPAKIRKIQWIKPPKPLQIITLVGWCSYMVLRLRHQRNVKEKKKVCLRRTNVTVNFHRFG